MSRLAGTKPSGPPLPRHSFPFAAVPAAWPVGLAAFAERFREEGFAAIAFDYRNFGGSGGQPREVLSVPRQRADYGAVIGWAVEQHARSRTRCLRQSAGRSGRRQIIAWGTCFAGMFRTTTNHEGSRSAGNG
jgi:hypothetical protein